MATRQRLLARVASLIPAARGSDCTLVGVDGRDGAGKTFFADELAAAAKHGGRVVVRISLDDFHHQRARRYRLGSQSPEGFFMDSYDYEAFAERVLRPLGSGGSRVYWARSHDLATDRILDNDEEPPRVADPGSVVIVDGMFLHRDEMRGAWDFSVFLDVEAGICAERMRLRDGTAPPLVPEARYFGGQLLYFRSCKPWERATLVVDNSQVDAPVLKSPCAGRGGVEAQQSN